MAEYMATTEDLKTVADSIRAKGGTSAPLAFPDGFATAVGAITSGKPEQEKTVSITENGDVTITPDVGKLLSKVIAQVNVPTGGGGDVKPFSRIEVGSVTFSQWGGSEYYPPDTKDLAFLILTAAPSGATFDIGESAYCAVATSKSLGVPNPNGTFGGAWVYKNNYYLPLEALYIPQYGYLSTNSDAPPKYGVEYTVIMFYGPVTLG